MNEYLVKELSHYLADVIERSSGSTRDVYIGIAIKLLSTINQPYEVQIATVKRFILDYLHSEEHYNFMKDDAREALEFIAKTETDCVLGYASGTDEEETNEQ